MALPPRNYRIDEVYLSVLTGERQIGIELAAETWRFLVLAMPERLTRALKGTQA
jgi:hypothetical protein